MLTRDLFAVADLVSCVCSSGVYLGEYTRGQVPPPNKKWSGGVSMLLKFLLVMCICLYDIVI